MQDRSARHAGVFDGDDFANGLFGEDHPARVDSEVPRQRQGFVRESHDVFGNLGGFRRVESPPPFDKPRPRVLVVDPVSERASDVADGVLGSIGDDVGDLGGVSPTVFLEHVLDDFFAAVGVEVDVDVGRFVTQCGQEAFERQPVRDRVDGGDSECVTDGRVRGATPPLTEDSARACELDDVVNDEEVAGEVEFLDDGEFPFDSFGYVGSGVRVQPRDGRPDEFPQSPHDGLPLGQVEFR